VRRDSAAAAPLLGRTLALASLLAAPSCSAGEAAVPAGGGGEWRDSGAGVTADSAADAAEEVAVVDYCADAGGRSEGSTFADLYRDFFGPTGLASCSARSICHVSGGTGAQTSGGYECVPDEPSCWASMTSTIVPEGGSATPEQTTLYLALRKAPPIHGSGPMPRNSSFAFCPDDLARITTWIEAGAQGP
jgi:hypothetical protein